MAIQCPVCGRDYDVTLFQFGQRVRCECGKEIQLSHRAEIGNGAEPTCEIRVLESRGVSVVELCGELTYQGSARLRESLRPVLESPGIGVLLDFGRVVFVTSSALDVIVEAWSTLEKQGVPMAFASLQGNVRKVLEAARLTEQIRLFSSREAAVEYLARPA